MTQLDELRRALADETEGLRIDLPTDLIRRRARRVRTRRTALGAAVVAIVLAVAVPVLAGGKGRSDDLAKPGEVCVTPTTGPVTVVRWLGRSAQTGITVDMANTRFAAVVGLVGSVDAPVLVVALEDLATGGMTYLNETALNRAQNRDIVVKGEPGTAKIVSNRQLFAPDIVLDVGVYAARGHRVTVTSEGREIDAHTIANEPTGWTVFWAERRAATPLSTDVTLKAYADEVPKVNTTRPATLDNQDALSPLDRRPPPGPTCTRQDG